MISQSATKSSAVYTKDSRWRARSPGNINCARNPECAGIPRTFGLPIFRQRQTNTALLKLIVTVITLTLRAKQQRIAARPVPRALW